MAAQDPNVSTESKGGALVGTAAAFLALSWLSVFLRTYVRAVMLKGFRADDWLMLVAQINYTVSCAFILQGVYYGLGRHNKSLDQFHEIEALKYQALATATYIADMMFIKLSIGIFLLRLATQKRSIYTIYGSVFVVSVWSIVLFFWNLFQCNPVAAQWDYRILVNDKTASCVDANQVVNAAYSLSVLTVLTDWFYALIPIPMVWKVKMTKQAKATVMVVLGLGVFASIATLIRLKFLADLTDLEDLLFATTDAMVWTLIEPGVAIVASSLVTIRPLLRAWRITGFQSTENSRPTGPLSHGQGVSRGTRPNGMPGFGSKDMSCIDVEAAHAKQADLGASIDQSKRSNTFQMSRITERTSEDRDITDDSAKHMGSRHRHAERHSEMYGNDGARSPHLPGHTVHRDTWPLSHSASSSEVELATRQPVHMPSDSRIGF
ncbi:integral membrane family protein [Seiridium cupressi]